jgi:capsid protein
MVKYVLQPIFNAWLENEIMLGRIKLSLSRFKSDPFDYVNTSWSFPARSWVDPLKDMLAIEKEFNLGLITKSDLAQKRGRTYEDILKARQHDRELEKQYGEPMIMPTSDGAILVENDDIVDEIKEVLSKDDVTIDNIKAIFEKYGV